MPPVGGIAELERIRKREAAVQAAIHQAQSYAKLAGA